MAHSASVRARALALVLEGGLHFRQAAERLAVELGDGAPHARTIARWVDAEIGAGRAVLPPWVYRRRGEAVVEEAMGMCLCSIRDCGFSHVKVSGLVMGACRPLLQGLV